MKNLINIYNLSTQFNYFINIENKLIYIYTKYCYFILKLPSLFFYKIEEGKIKLLFIDLFSYLSFLKLISTFYNKLFSFYYFKLKLKGLGYRVRQLSKYLIKIYFNRTNYYYMHISKTIIFKYRTRRLFFFGNSYIHLYLSLLNFIYLKEHSIYRISGIMYPNKILLLKPGKNKFR